MEPTEGELAEARVDVAAASGKWHEPRRPAEGWRPDAVHTDLVPPKLYSRWRGGVLSFTLPTKLMLTFAVVLMVPWMAWKFSGPLAIGPIAIWHIIVTPRVLGDLWRRSRIR